MTTFLVTRHKASVEWILQQGIEVDVQLEHLVSLETISTWDTVIGVLPITLACEINEKGAHYIHFGIDIPKKYRGQELSLDVLSELNPRLEKFFVRRG